MKKIMKVTNNQGITFNVKVVRRGEGYGVNKSIIHDRDDFLIEFYDTRFANKGTFDAEGQFVSRYFASTLLNHTNSNNSGLALDSGISNWYLTTENMHKVRQFILKFMTNSF